jgi:hypothetical protein
MYENRQTEILKEEIEMKDEEYLNQIYQTNN